MLQIDSISAGYGRAPVLHDVSLDLGRARHWRSSVRTAQERRPC